MSTSFDSSLPVWAAKQSATHPLAPIDATEIRQAVSSVQSQWPAGTDLHFRSITLQEPAKKEVVPYLDASALGATLPQIDRRVFVTYYIRKTVRQRLYPCIASILTVSTEQVSRGRRQLDHKHSRVQSPPWSQPACAWRWLRASRRRASCS